jgi:hypothetical protein
MKAMQKKAPVGRSSKMKDGKNAAPAKLGKAHSSGKTVPSFNAARMDKMEATNPTGTGGVKH